MFQNKNRPILENEKKILAQKVSSLRLEGEGKGEFKAGGQRLIFSFESVLEKTKYMIYANIFGKGEEEFGVSWKFENPLKFAQLHGSLLNEFLRKNYQYEKEQKEFVLFFAKSLLFLQDLKNEKFTEYCVRSEQEINCSKDGAVISIDQSKSQSVKIIMKAKNSSLPYIVAKTENYKGKDLTNIILKKDFKFLFKWSESELMSLRLLIDI